MNATGNIARFVRWNTPPPPRPPHEAVTFLTLVLVLGAGAVLLVWCLFAGCEARPAEAAEVQSGTASYYTVASAIKEGTCTDAQHKVCLQANGRPLKDDAFTAASWDYRFGTRLRVCRLVASGHGLVEASPCVIVSVSDRGPARALYRGGRIIDLSKSAYRVLAPLKTGVINVTVTRLP